MAITPETLQLVAALRRAVDDITDDTVRDLTRAWVRAWDVVSGEMSDAVLDLVSGITDGRWPSRAEINRHSRLTKALAQIADTLAELAREALRLIAAAAAQALRLAVEGQERIVTSQLPSPSQARRRGRGLVWNRVDPAVVAWMVERTTQRIHSRRWHLEDQAVQAMKTELVRGVVVGANPRETARRMVRRVEGAFNGGLARAANIARTETLDAHRAGARAAQAANDELLAGWVWLAQLSPRTCASCWAKHGNLYPLSVPGPLDHQSGRCSRMPKTKSWAELGFTGIDEPDDFVPDARAAFDALPYEDQLKILGPTRLRMLRDGEIDWADLSTRRTTDGWRDSYIVTPVADLRAGRRPSRDDPDPPITPGGPQPQPQPPAAAPGASGAGRGGAGTPPSPPAASPAPEPPDDTSGGSDAEVSDQPVPYRITPSGRPNLGDLIPVDDPTDEEYDAIVDLVTSTIEGTYAGLDVRVIDVRPEAGLIYVEGEIDDPDGHVGDFERYFRRERGTGALYADHVYLRLDPGVRGQGFAAEFNGFLFDWYEESGFERVEVHADIDVGGYTWATQGFDFSSQSSAEGVLRRLRAEMEQLEDALEQNRHSLPLGTVQAMEDEIRAARDILDRAERSSFGDPDYPTAFEISQAGRLPGQHGPNASWIGKRAMLGSDWYGVLWLPRSSRAGGAAGSSGSSSSGSSSGGGQQPGTNPQGGSGSAGGPPTPNPPASATPPPLPDLGALIPHDHVTDYDQRQAIEAAIKNGLEGTYAGLSVHVTGVGIGRDWISADGEIRDPSTGNVVGQFDRIFARDVDGTLFAEHKLLNLNPQVRGRGFAAEFNGHLYDWYRRSGFERVELFANIDVGGYAWAAAGYDFATEEDALNILLRLEAEAEVLEDRLVQARRTGGDPREIAAMEAEVQAAREIISRAETTAFGTPGYPSAQEISQAGRLPGQGRDASWIGKRAMLGSAWEGVLWLNRQGGGGA